MQAQPEYASVIIIGAGPTGLAAANLLGLAGIDTLLIERNATLSAIPRAISIDDEGLRICQAMGLATAQQQQMLFNVEAHYFSHGRPLARVAPTNRRNGYPLISTFHQPAFEAILFKGLDRFPCITVLFQHSAEAVEQDEEGVSLTMRAPDGELRRLRAAYLLACDGARSTIRRTLNIAMRPVALPFLPDDKGHGERWLVVDTINEHAPPEAESLDESTTPPPVITFFCDPERPAVSVPAPGNRHRWEFMLLPGDQEEAMLDPAAIEKLIQRKTQQQNRLVSSFSPSTTIVRGAIYTFHTAIASRLSQGRIFLLGDAAHLMPPFGGQGMNSGLRDTHNLCWKLALVLRHQAAPRLLATYEQERAPHAAQMILFSSILGKLIMPTVRPIAFLRDLFFRGLVNPTPLLRTIVTEMGVKPQPHYTRGLLLPPHNRGSRSLTGQFLPQPALLTLEGQHIPLDDLLGPGLSLVRLHEDPHEAFALLRADLWHTLEVRKLCVLPQQQVREGIAALASQHDCTCVIDSEQRLAAFLGRYRGCCLLVRPDRYIMGAFCDEDIARYEQELVQLLGLPAHA